MVNVIIYLNNQQNAQELVKYLLKESLIASASIDENNVSYRIGASGFDKVTYQVITAQTKALLFKDIVAAVEARLGSEVTIISMPIVASNSSFDQFVREKTTKA